MKKENEPKFLAVDFYCGAGGTTRGLSDAGGYVIAGVDKDPACRRTYQENNPNWTLDRGTPEYLEMDMFPAAPDHPEGQQDEIMSELNRLLGPAKENHPQLPLLFAICAPCQSFTKYPQPHMSEGRTRARATDSSLIAQSLPFIERFKPEMILCENVAGIEKSRYAAVWTDFIEQLKEKGYRVGTSTVCAADHGVPQNRKRSIIMAVKRKDGDEAKNEPIAMPQPTGEGRKPTVADAISHLPALQAGEKDEKLSNHACLNLSETNKSRLRALAPGQPNHLLPDELALPCHRRLEKKGRKGFEDPYTRLRPDRPAPTITTRFNSVSNGRFGHYDPEQTRGLSLLEGALLQSFPEGYRFRGGSAETVARMIGNSVPPKLAASMAEHLCAAYGKNPSQENPYDACEAEPRRTQCLKREKRP